MSDAVAVANSAISAGGAIANAIGGAKLGKKMRKFAREEAAKQRDWQKEMSGSAYQRSMADMKAAGLNPMLVMGGPGASTPSGAKADGPNLMNIAKDSVNSAIQGTKLGREGVMQTETIANMRRTGTLIESQTAKSNADAAKVGADTLLADLAVPGAELDAKKNQVVLDAASSGRKEAEKWYGPAAAGAKAAAQNGLRKMNSWRQQRAIKNIKRKKQKDYDETRRLFTHPRSDDRYPKR